MSEDRLNTAKKILTGSALLIVTQFTTLLLSFLGQRIILSTLTKEENGFLFSERRIVDLIVLMLVDFGLNGVVMRRMVQDPARAPITLSSSIALRMLLWVPATLCCVLYASIAGYSVVDVATWCCFLMLSSRAGLVRYAFEQPRRSHMKFGLVLILVVLDAVLFLVGIYLIRDTLTASLVIQVYTLSALPGFVLLLLLDRGKVARLSNVRWQEMRVLFFEALPVVSAIVLVNLHDKIDAMMLGWFSTQTEVGIFGAVYVSLSPLSGVIPIAIAMAIVPAIARFSGEDWDECRKFTLTGMRYLMIVAVVACTVASSLTPFVIDIISKGRYADNALQFFTFLWVPIPIFFIVYAQEVNVALGQQRANIPVAIALALVTVIVGLVLIPMYDSMGAIITKFAAVTIGSFIAARLMYSILRSRVDVAFIVKIICASAVGVIASWYFPTMMGMWLAAACSCIAVIVFILGSGLFRTSDIGLLRRILQARHA